MARPRRAGACAWGLALVITVVLVPSPRIGADPADEALLLSQTVASRAQRRIGTVARSPALDVVARRHAARLAATAGPPFHNPALGAETAGWQAVGEVVGRINAGPGWDVALQRMFLASPAHRSVILSPAYNAVGIGVARSADGVINAVEVFGRDGLTRVAPPPRVSRRQRVLTPPTSAPPPPTSTTTSSTTTTSTTSTTAPPVHLGGLAVQSGSPAPTRNPATLAVCLLVGACLSLARALRRGAKKP